MKATPTAPASANPTEVCTIPAPEEDDELAAAPAVPLLASEAVVVASTVVLGAPALTTVVVLSVGLEKVVFREMLGPPVPTLPVPDSVTLPERVTVAFATEDEKVVVMVEV